MEPVERQPQYKPHYYNPPEPTAEEQMLKEQYRSLTMEASVALKGTKEIKGVLQEFGVPLESPVVRMTWGFLTDETVKTTITENEYHLKMMEWRAYKCKVIDSLAALGDDAYRRYRKDIDNVGSLIEVRTRRAIGGFERKMIVTTSNESVQSVSNLFEDRGQPQQKGWLRKLVGI